MLPVSIKVDENKLKIIWDDKSESVIKLANLRRFCPCALCDEEKSKQSSSYIPIYSAEELSITSIKPVGNYALGIFWKDEHNTGIYDYNYLIKLSE